MTANSYTTTSNSYLHISRLLLLSILHGSKDGGVRFTPDFGAYGVVVAGVDRVQVSVGENLKVTLSFIRQDNVDKDITYLVISECVGVCVSSYYINSFNITYVKGVKTTT